MRAPRSIGVLCVLLAACGSTGRTGMSAPLPPTPAPALEHRPIEGPASPAANAAGVIEGPSTAAGEGAAPAVEPEGSDEPDEPVAGRPVGRVAGVPILAEDLLQEWHQLAGREVLLVVDKLVATRLAYAEAARLGMRLAPEAVEVRVGQEREKLEQRVASAGRGLTVEQYLQQELGVEPARYFERLRTATLRQMIAERAVRAWTLSNETVALRLIVVPDEEEMNLVVAALEEGADFAELARAHSVDDTAELGGYVPYLVRQERSALARLAFSTPVGEVGGPLPTADHRFLIRVEECRAPLEGDWSVVSEAVEESLASHGLSDAEFVHWKTAMAARYPIDLTRLQELLGARG